MGSSLMRIQDMNMFSKSTTLKINISSFTMSNLYSRINMLKDLLIGTHIDEVDNMKEAKEIICGRKPSYLQVWPLVC